MIHPVRQTEIINTKGQKSRDWKDDMFLQITETWMEMEIINTNSEMRKEKKRSKDCLSRIHREVNMIV